MKSIRAVAILIHNDKVLLMHRINEGKEYFVFPGGGVEEGETIENAVLREIKEETTLKIKIDKLLYRHIYDDGSEQYFYLCSYLGGEPKLGSGNELEEMSKGGDNYYNPVWIDIDLVKNMLVYPLEIRDSFLEDIDNGFNNIPKTFKIEISKLRQTL